MHISKVRELMVPLGDFASVPQEATLYEAVLALEAAQKHLGKEQEKQRAILVLDPQGRVIGKINQWTVLRALEPRYQEIENLKETPRYGFNASTLVSMIETYGLWRKPLEGLCQKAAEVRVRDIMSTPDDTEFINEDAPLDTAIHQLVMGHHQSLLVTRGETVVGILRLCDVFRMICDSMKACHL